MATPLSRGAGVLTSLVRADGLLVVPAATEGHQAGERVEVELLRGLDEIRRTIVVDRVARPGAGPGRLAAARRATRGSAWPPPTSARSAGWWPCGTGCATWPARTCSTRQTGGYTLPYVDRLLEGREVSVVRLVQREQGLLVRPGNPLGLAGITDLTRRTVRYVNRQRGAGTRMLLDSELARRGLVAEDVNGYAREEHTHLAVAAAVAVGPRRLRPGHPRRRARLRPGLRPGDHGALRPRRRCRPARRPPARPLLGAAPVGGLPGVGRGPGRLLHRRDGPADP